MEETYHVTFSEDDEASTQSSTKGDEINFNEDKSFHDDEFLVPRTKTHIDAFEYQNTPVNEVEPLPSTISRLANMTLDTLAPQDRGFRDKHILFVNILEIEPKKLVEALKEEGRVIAMQKELNQFERNKFWTLLPITYGKTITET
ncbi:hypothetical protein Tco_1120527 [Tanacetum coccineum]